MAFIYRFDCTSLSVVHNELLLNVLVDITFSSVVRAVAYDERFPGIDFHRPRPIFRDNICCTVTHLCLCCHSFVALVCEVLERKRICAGFFFYCL
jgi:hypothetical protein